MSLLVRWSLAALPHVRTAPVTHVPMDSGLVGPPVQPVQTFSSSLSQEGKAGLE